MRNVEWSSSDGCLGGMQPLDELSARGLCCLRERLKRAQAALEAQGCRLESLSPLAVLKRG